MKQFKKQNRQGGFIGTIIIIIIALVLLSYAGVDVKGILVGLWNALIFIIRLLVGIIQSAWVTLLDIWNKALPQLQSLQSSPK